MHFHPLKWNPTVTIQLDLADAGYLLQIKLFSMPGEELLKLLKDDIGKWNKLRENNEQEAIRLIEAKPPELALRDLVWSDRFKTLIDFDFSGANLQQAHLQGAMLGIYHILATKLTEKGLSSGDLSELQPGLVCLKNANLEHADLTEANLDGSDLRGANLEGANLTKASLRNANLEDADLFDANFESADLTGACLRKAKLIGLPEWMMMNPHETVGKYKPRLNHTILDQVDFSGARLNGLDLRSANLSKTKKFCQAKFVKADLGKALLMEADMRDADLRETNLSEANLKGAKLNQIKYAGLYKRKIRSLGYAFSRENYKAADIRGANLCGANLNRVDLSGMDLTGTQFVGARLKNANLSRTNLTGKDFRKVNLLNADLSFCILVQTDFRKANLTGCRIHGIAVWDVLMQDSVQSRLVITRPDEATITVDSIQMAQFIYFLLNRKNLLDFFETITSKVVLILGRFTPERKRVLEGVAEEIRKYNMLPIIFDFDRPASRDFTETIKTLAGISLFIIADISNPHSAPLELQAVSPDYQIPIVPIIQEGEKPFSMFRDLTAKYDWVLDLKQYSSLETLLSDFKVTVIDRALKKHQELQVKKQRLVNSE